MKSRYWQMIRGICILAVIMIHCPTGESREAQTIWLVLRQLINFPVAVFIFMAGYFVKPEKVTMRWGYLKNRGGRLIVPFLLWSTLYTIKNVIFGGTYSWKEVLFAFVTGQSAAPLYYILVMLQLMLLTPSLVRIENKQWLYAVTPIYLCGLYGWNFCFGSTPPLYGTIFPAWLIFYLLGMDAKKGKLESWSTKVSIAWVAVGLLLALVESFALLKAGCSRAFACSQIKFSSFIYAGAIVLLLVKNQQLEGRLSNFESALGKVGDDSYGIFYSHMMVMYAVSKILRITGLASVWVAFWILNFIFTALLSFFLVELAKKLISNRKMQVVLGLI